MGSSTNQLTEKVGGIAEVARVSGVSKATVSKALHPSRRYDVSERVRARVTRAATQLGYRPNWRGHALASGKSFTIGLLYAHANPLPGDTYERTVSAAAHVLAPRGYHLMHVPLAGAQIDWKSLVETHRIDGCLVVAPIDQSLANFLLESSLRSVLVNINTELPFSQVQSDDAAGVAALVQHLRTLGHHRIMFCDGRVGASDWNMAMRVDEYNVAMEEEGIAARLGSVEDAVRACDGSEAERITAVIGGELGIGIDLLHQFWRAKISVPGDVSLATFGDGFATEKSTPPLTAFGIPAESLGREAASLLLDQIEQKQSPLPRKIIVRGSLAVRESTAPPSSQSL